MARSTKIVGWLAKPCRWLFAGKPMPELQVPLAPDTFNPQVAVGFD
jgi:hypothetical protein